MRTYDSSRGATEKFICVSVFLGTLLVLGVVAAPFEETAQPKFVAVETCGSATEAFEKGYVDVLITFRPEVSTVTAKKGESVTVKLYITCRRRDPAPEVIELRIGPNSPTVDIPCDESSTLSDSRTYSRVNDYITFEPKVITIRDGETVQASITIKFLDDFLRAINYNEKVPIPISVYRPDVYRANENFSLGLQEEDPLEVVP